MGVVARSSTMLAAWTLLTHVLQQLPPHPQPQPPQQPQQHLQQQPLLVGLQEIPLLLQEPLLVQEPLDQPDIEEARRECTGGENSKLCSVFLLIRLHSLE